MFLQKEGVSLLPVGESDEAVTKRRSHRVGRTGRGPAGIGVTSTAHNEPQQVSV